jgi:hypothetical protein
MTPASPQAAPQATRLRMPLAGLSDGAHARYDHR